MGQKVLGILVLQLLVFLNSVELFAGATIGLDGCVSPTSEDVSSLRINTNNKIVYMRGIPGPHSERTEDSRHLRQNKEVDGVGGVFALSHSGG